MVLHQDALLEPAIESRRRIESEPEGGIETQHVLPVLARPEK